MSTGLRLAFSYSPLPQFTKSWFRPWWRSRIGVEHRLSPDTEVKTFSHFDTLGHSSTLSGYPVDTLNILYGHVGIFFSCKMMVDWTLRSVWVIKHILLKHFNELCTGKGRERKRWMCGSSVVLDCFLCFVLI